MAGALTIHEAAETTGWSPRMLRYIERSGLVEPARSASGYRLYGPAELQRLRTLRELLQRFDVALSDVSFAARMRNDADLRAAVDAWLEDEARRPEHVPASDWLRWEQEKHERLLGIPAADSVGAQAAASLRGAASSVAATALLLLAPCALALLGSRSPEHRRAHDRNR